MKEETKTAEEAVKIFKKHDPFETIKASVDQWVIIVNAMKQYAEQARREERERHSKLVEIAKGIVLRWGSPSAKQALAAAGYGKEGE